LCKKKKPVFPHLGIVVASVSCTEKQMGNIIKNWVIKESAKEFDLDWRI
jgi:hypothetical protein